jgi:hypothetical protein
MTNILWILWKIAAVSKAENYQGYHHCRNRRSYSKLLEWWSHQTALTMQKRRGWKWAGGEGHGAVKYVVRQERHCMLGSDKAGSVNQACSSSHRLEKVQMSKYSKLRFELQVVSWVLENSDELRFIQLISAPFFTGVHALLLGFLPLFSLPQAK